jgi:hypothetical protein
MKSISKPIVMLLFAALAPLLSSAQIITEKVYFPAGESSTLIDGELKGGQTIDYVVSGKQSQKLEVTINSSSNAACFNILLPGPEEMSVFNSQLDGTKASMNLDKSGNYTIRVYQKKSSQIFFSLKIALLAGRVSESYDAKVSGTNFNATGQLRSVLGSTSMKCDFGVIRYTNGGEVHVTMKGRGKRIFVFTDGKWSCKSSKCKLTYGKIKEDEWEVVCNGKEKYYIPEGVIYGG